MHPIPIEEAKTAAALRELTAETEIPSLTVVSNADEVFDRAFKKLVTELDALRQKDKENEAKLAKLAAEVSKLKTDKERLEAKNKKLEEEKQQLETNDGNN